MGVKRNNGKDASDVVAEVEVEKKPEDWHTGRQIHSGARCPRIVQGRNGEQQCTGTLLSHGRKKAPDGVNWRLFRCPHCRSVRFRNPG